MGHSDKSSALSCDILEQELRSDDEHPSQFLGATEELKVESASEDDDKWESQSQLRRDFSQQQRYPKLKLYGGGGGYGAEGQRYYEIDEAGSSVLRDMSLAYGGDSVFCLPQTKWRAKLYQLNNQGAWDDFGTGEFSIVKNVGDSLSDLLNRILTTSITWFSLTKKTRLPSF